MRDVEWWERTEILLPIAHRLQQRDGAARLPPPAPDRISRARRVAAASEAAERHVLGEVLSALNAAGVNVLLLKGAALSYTVYPLPWLRPRSDIDLLVRPGMLPRVADVLRHLDFSAAREVSHPLISRQRHFHRSHGVPVALDVHDALVNPPVLRLLPEFDVLWARAQSASGLRVAARALATPDALLHALVHRVAHHNSSVNLLWLYDMHLLAGRMQDRDWSILIETAECAQVCQIAADGLGVLSRTLDSAVPAAVVERLTAARPEASAALLGGGLTEWRLQLINFKSLGWRERLAFARAHLMPPADELAIAARPAQPLPVRYASRAVRGARKWLRPISQVREF
jgi:hypothetical protein